MFDENNNIFLSYQKNHRIYLIKIETKNRFYKMYIKFKIYKN